MLRRHVINRKPAQVEIQSLRRKLRMALQSKAETLTKQLSDAEYARWVDETKKAIGEINKKIADSRQWIA